MSQEKVFISSRISDIGSDKFTDCLAHTFCYQGSATFEYNSARYTIKKGDCMIIRKRDTFSLVEESSDLIVMTIFVTPEFIVECTPRSNYGTRGQMMLYENPIMELDVPQQTLLSYDFMNIRLRLQDEGNLFHEQVVRNSIEAMILDFFDFHSKKYGGEKITGQFASIMTRFIALLDAGDYVHDREVAYYADKLCVTPKYLSEVSRKVTGYPANYWITKYTVNDIALQLKDKTKSFVEISDYFGFSSPAYFTRYVQNNLGATPTDFRD